MRLDLLVAVRERVRERVATSSERGVEVLAKSAWPRIISAYALAGLAARGSQLRQGQIPFTANEAANGLSVALSGSVRAFPENMDGREQTMHGERAGGAQCDEIVFLYKLARRGQHDLFLRRIEFRDEPHQRTLIFLTNHRQSTAATIARI